MADPDILFLMDSPRSAGRVGLNILFRSVTAAVVLGLSACQTPPSDVKQPESPPGPAVAPDERSYWTFDVSYLQREVPPPLESGFNVPVHVEEMPRFQPESPSEPDDEEPLPDRFDWREQGVVGPVQDQGECGSCWAHAACTVAEAAAAIQGSPFQEVSRDWLITCNVDQWGCQGGQLALPYFVDRPDLCGEVGGVLARDDLAREPGCQCERERMARFESWGMVSTREQPQDVDVIKRVIQQSGPIVATIQLSMPLMGYSSGVFNYRLKSAPVNFLHLVVITGWDESQGPDGIWYVQNSWGENWGEDGAMRIGYGVSRVAEYAAAFGQVGGQETGSGQEVTKSKADPVGGAEEVPGSATAVADPPSTSTADGTAQTVESPAVAEEASLADVESESPSDESMPAEVEGTPMPTEEIEATDTEEEDGRVPPAEAPPAETPSAETPSADAPTAAAPSAGSPPAETAPAVDDAGEPIPAEDSSVMDDGVEVPAVDLIIENIDYLDAALAGDPLGVDEPLPMPVGPGSGSDQVTFSPGDVARGQSRLIGIWRQVDGRNEADVAPGGYLQSVLRVSPSGLLEWTRRHDKSGKLRTVTRLDWKEDGEVILVGQVEMLQKRRMTPSLRLPGRGGETWSILSPTRPLPARLKWSLQGDVLVLDGRRYRRYRGGRY